MKSGVPAFTFLAIFIAAAASAQTTPFAVSGCTSEAITFNDVRLPQAVLANGKPLAAGTYQVRITTERPTPPVGQSATGECWVEFVKAGIVAGREMASVVPSEDIGTIAKEPAPKLNSFRVELLKQGDYLRVWMNRDGTHYIINMPVTR